MIHKFFTISSTKLSIVLLAFLLFNACTSEQEQAVAEEITEVISKIETSAHKSVSNNANEIKIFKKIENTAAEDLEVYVKMPAGVLQIKGGTENLMYAGFVISNQEFEPKINYEKIQNTDIITIATKKEHHNIEINDSSRNVWNIKLNENIETELNIEIGAGTAKIFAADLDVKKLKVTAGAGKLDIYLNKDFRHDVNAKIAGGIGVTNIYLPKNQAIMVTTNKGIGAINNHGLIQDGLNYTNSLYKTATRVIRVDVSAGIGAINLIVED